MQSILFISRILVALLEYIGTLNTEVRVVGIYSNLAQPWGGGAAGKALHLYFELKNLLIVQLIKV